MKMSDWVYDREAKEFVQISNGIEKDGVFTATEAMAIRFVCIEKDKVILAFTYRKVHANQLAETTTTNELQFLMNNPKGASYEFIGRI